MTADDRALGGDADQRPVLPCGPGG